MDQKVYRLDKALFDRFAHGALYRPVHEDTGDGQVLGRADG